MIRPFVLGLTIVGAVSIRPLPAAQPPADLVLVNGKVATLAQPAIAEAVAVRAVSVGGAPGK